MEVLQKVDEVAYVRFASVYRSFRNIGEFINEVQNLSGRQDTPAAAAPVDPAPADPPA
jgi:transcriptional repressor NrdR